MRTPLMSDEELDALARRSAAAYPDELPLGAWQQLENQLDAAAQQRQVQQQVRHRVAELFLLEMLLLGFLMIGWQSQQLLQKQRPARPEPLAATPASAPDKQQAASVARRSGRLEPVAAAVSRPPAASAGMPGSSGTEALALPQADAFYQPTQPATRRQLPLQYLAAGRPYHVTWQANKPQEQLGSPVGQQQPAVVAEPAVAGLSDSPTAAQATPLIAPQDSGRMQPAAVPPASAVAADSMQPRSATAKPMYRLLLGVTVAPELAAVRPRQLAGPGLTAGLVAEYRLTPHWRVRSGLLYSVKRYEARGSDYRPPASYWTWRTPVDRIEADCRLVEIPLDVRYEVRPQPTYSLFASAGLSSFLMRNEQYTYDYSLNGQYLERTWSLARGSNHMLSVLNLSVGCERTLGGRWAAQAEPFVKLPLGGVGFGRIQLRSAGLAVGLKYGLLAARP
ncbi:outer membrane beta-barrel protein [Hymenobacter yonginensis]|uniref:Outer membrane beta-barrel protein n=1 Tax=Hymenobacter yonginensis TaxID=748197 RepID=A0ABY7PJ96_9BACT|nr:outer membrane beta-barrel protein [Hymenobacter yonginensis]WBO83376.1 outer membrane beta-barrel protein [Hymenobacter yonginensis]